MEWGVMAEITVSGQGPCKTEMRRFSFCQGESTLVVYIQKDYGESIAKHNQDRSNRFLDMKGIKGYQVVQGL